ncbi:MAG: hypothetical protein KKF44_06875 [Nanoarchaeota archaeon]|nr:hypothetical protein [Nanoarchaeota archaeon]
MKTLIAYYSRSGNTQKVAEKLKNELNCDIERIVDKKSRKGVMGFILGGKDAIKKNLTQINPVEHEPHEYDLVLVGTPNWGNTMAPAMRTYLHENILDKKAAFFTTAGSSAPERITSALKDMAPKAKVVATINLVADDFKKGYDERLKKFVEKLR